jgi:membrane associated rhomboid family serine protease
LRQTLKQLVPRNESGFSSDHPMMGMVYVAGALLGLFAGVMLTPKNANDSTLGLFAVAGAVSGVVLLYLLVWVSDRHLKIGLAQPIGFAMCGAFAGLLSHSMLRPLVGWEAAMAFLAAGAVIGCLFGIFKVTREQRK